MEFKKYKIREVAEIRGRIGFRGYTVNDLVNKDEGAITFSPTNINNHAISYENCDYISFEKYDESPEIQIFNGDIIFTKTGSTFGKCAYIEGLSEKATINPQFVVFKEIKCNSKYLYYILRSKWFQNNIRYIVSGSTIPTMSQEDLKNVEIYLPAKDKQDKIADYLSAIDSKIALNQSINQNLEAMAKQLYDYWFVQFDFPNEEGKPYKSSGGKMVWNEKLKREIPEQWTNKTLRELINLEDTKRIPLSTKEREERKGTYPYYGATGIMGYVNDYVVDGDYLLLAEDGSTSDSNGNPIVQYIWGKNWINNHAHIINPKSENQLYYFSFLLKSIPAVLIETGSIQKKISQDNLLSFYVVSPTENIVQRYSDMVNVLQEMRKSNFDNIIELTKQRDELLPLLMNGQVSVL